MWPEFSIAARDALRSSHGPHEPQKLAARVARVARQFAKVLAGLMALNVPAYIYLGVCAGKSTGALPAYGHNPVPTVMGLAVLLVHSLLFSLSVQMDLHEEPGRVWWPVARGRMFQSTIYTALGKHLYAWAAVGWPTTALVLGGNGFRPGQSTYLGILLTLVSAAVGVLLTVALVAIARYWRRVDAMALAWGLVGGAGLAVMLLIAGLSGTFAIGSWSLPDLQAVVPSWLGRFFAVLHAVAAAPALTKVSACAAAVAVIVVGASALSRLHYGLILRPNLAAKRESASWLGLVGGIRFRGKVWAFIRRDLLTTVREPKEFAQTTVLFVIFLFTLPLVFKESGLTLRLFLVWSLAFGIAGSYSLHSIGREGFGLATMSQVLGIQTYLVIRLLITTLLMAITLIPILILVVWLGRTELTPAGLAVLLAMAVVNIVGLSVHTIGSGALFADIVEKRIMPHRGVTIGGEIVFWMVGGLWIVAQTLVLRDHVLDMGKRGAAGGLIVILCVVYFVAQWSLAVKGLSRRI